MRGRSYIRRSKIREAERRGGKRSFEEDKENERLVERRNSHASLRFSSLYEGKRVVIIFKIILDSEGRTTPPTVLGFLLSPAPDFFRTLPKKGNKIIYGCKRAESAASAYLGTDTYHELIIEKVDGMVRLETYGEKISYRHNRITLLGITRIYSSLFPIALWASRYVEMQSRRRRRRKKVKIKERKKVQRKRKKEGKINERKRKEKKTGEKK